MIEDDVVGVAADQGYEPPVLFDLGSVYDITFGSASGSSDASGQSFN
ncbi:hypothetical protein SAMN04488000_10616 [Lentzea albida]|uniref:Lasso RiPP family leader peptide-containing protein n=1 Tax=Lentzea albida TaxID=65499 RepID=A0A1H9L9W7_9PSEU|nr:hypothetical protein SAMN04488000_10616 [Lentzea albida]